jgi:hypothetical protein
MAGGMRVGSMMAEKTRMKEKTTMMQTPMMDGVTMREALIMIIG